MVAPRARQGPAGHRAAKLDHAPDGGATRQYAARVSQIEAQAGKQWERTAPGCHLFRNRTSGRLGSEVSSAEGESHRRWRRTRVRERGTTPRETPPTTKGLAAAAAGAAASLARTRASSSRARTWPSAPLHSASKHRAREAEGLPVEAVGIARQMAFLAYSLLTLLRTLRP
eukprot:scaffold94401_cov33-Tisochrysis_lutea.AAC.5